MRSRPLWILALGGAIFVSSLVAGVVAPACTGSGGGGDAGTDGRFVDPDACQDGTIQLLSCLTGPDGGPPVEHFSDEACINLDQAEMRGPVIQDNTRGATVSAPAQGQVIPGGSPFVFRWMPGSVSFRRVTPAFRAITASDEWSRWTRLIPEADAHCPPFNGVGYAAVFLSQGQEVLRAETEFLTYTPSHDAWMMLKGATPPLAMRVEVAQFDTSMLTGGPWEQSTPTSFTIGP